MYAIGTDKLKNRIYITLGAMETVEGEALVAGIKYEDMVGLAETIEDADRILGRI
ncbi:MAG: hypothetical protein NDI81_21430 [Desulfobacula sp.]|nr:hypothetical protein [Desulfobacula sp.]MDA8135929.1 hypothetical protein [Desulfobacteraceae bacterium]